MPAVAPLHLGLTPWNLGDDLSAPMLARQAEFAESLGYESLWLPESHFTGRGSLPEPLMLLAAIAARTRTMRLGTTSLLLPVRHPIQAAEQIAVLDHLSEGRLILGLGRGYQSTMFSVFDVPLAEKRDRFASCLATMQRAWRGEPLDEAGEAVLSPLPLQRPHPPIWVAAFGPKAIRQAGRLGAPYLASPMETLPVLIENYALLRDASVAVGHAPSTTVPVMRTVFVGEDRAVLDDVRLRVGQAAAQRRAVDAVVDDWAIIGTPDEVGRSIERYRAAIGMTHLIATRLRVGGVDAGLLERSLERLMEVKASL